ncbi:PIN domain-containing protein [Streptomyces sp. NPDC001480]|uniref:PIN domain-containing protein n=1 Tax=Streptomyces sp. NPDC001480 TaxID=3364577 RepID=UPI0036A6D93B
MIILDTNILWSLTPEGGSTDLLRAIRAVSGERVAVPWMVMEELAAQQALKYQEQHTRAAEAVKALREVTPWGLDVPLGPCEPEEVRKHWRRQWGTVVEVIPTSPQAFQEAAFREANQLRPCRVVKGLKIGSRDAAIWLTAVEYAQAHPEERVYFVSGNNKDFGDGTSYPAPMDKDVAGMTDRFRLLPSMADVVAEFATETTTDEAAVRALLEQPSTGSQLVDAATRYGWLPMDGSFECTISGVPGSEPLIVAAHGWLSGGRVSVSEIQSMHSYRFGQQEWCAAVVTWQLTGVILLDGVTTWAGCSLTASVLLALNGSEPRLTILRADTPQPLSRDIFLSFNLPRIKLSGAGEDAAEVMRGSVAASQTPVNLHPLRGPRAYEGAWARARRAQ